jgi:hypothetical protein
VIQWKVYYADGTACTNLEEIRPRGVLGVVNIDESTGWTLQAHRDYYVLVDGVEWWAVDLPGMMLYLSDNIGRAAVLFGQMVSNPRWKEFYNETLKKDPELPPKTAFRRAEPKG